MAERAIFLDRDNTIIEDKEGYIGDPAKVKLLPGSATAIAALRRLGYRIIVISNQSGVARGYFTENDVESVNQEMCRQLREQAGAHIDASYYCPYHPEAVIAEYRMEHEWRKPAPGMIKQAAEDFILDLANSWMIGDSPRDVASGAAAGCRTILIKDPEHMDVDQTDAGTAVSPNFIVKTLADAARIVAREGRNPHPDLVPMPLTEGATPTSAEIPAMAEAPAAPWGPPPLPPAAPATIDAQALVDKLAGQLQRTTPPQENVKPVLEEILIQLRQQQRANEIPESSLASQAAVIVQVFAIVCVVVAIWGAVTTPVTIENPGYSIAIRALIRSGLWMLGGIFLQGFVIALIAMGRRR